MRLYLSSFRTGDHPEHLVRLLRRPGPVAVVANAMDAASADVRAAAVRLELDHLAAVGLPARELDLRDYAHRGASDAPPDRQGPHSGDERRALADALQGVELLWVRGGNVFVLRHAMAVSGADSLIPQLLAGDALVYAGYSAGPCVLAPSLCGLEGCDDPTEVTRLYGTDPSYVGLGVLDYAFVPHIDSPGHPETELLGAVARKYAATGVRHRTLRDGQAIVVDGERTSIV